MGMVIFALLFDCGLIPNYMNIRNLGILNTYWALIIPSLATAYNVVIVKTFLLGIPGELEEAATIDGAGYWRRLFSITIPLLARTLEYSFVSAMIWIFTGISR